MPAGGLARERGKGISILLWDTDESRRLKVAQELVDCCAEVRSVEKRIELQEAQAQPGKDLALVGVSVGQEAYNQSLEIVCKLREKGFSVLAFADGLQKESVGIRCQALLAGAHRLFDSAANNFGDELREAVNTHARLAEQEKEERQQTQGTMRRLNVVGESEAMLSTLRWVLRVSRLSDLPVLLLGETGTGKEVLARAIYQLDPKRNRGPFVALNCSALNKGLAESELFGHRRGAFTGAEHLRKGLIRAADGGVLLLDEIGDLDLELQGKLLRVLQESRVLSLGEDTEVPVSVRVLVATHRNLWRMVQTGEFRADLYHRLNVLVLEIPPLRDRPEDVRPLVEHFVRKCQNLRADRRIEAGDDFVQALMQAELPGNAREVENLVRRAMAHKQDNGPLGLGDLPYEILQQVSESRRDSNQGRDAEVPAPQSLLPWSELPSLLGRLLEVPGGSLVGAMHQCERMLIKAALEKSNGNQSKTARLLGITPRSVYSKLHKYELQG